MTAQERLDGIGEIMDGEDFSTTEVQSGNEQNIIFNLSFYNLEGLQYP